MSNKKNYNKISTEKAKAEVVEEVEAVVETVEAVEVVEEVVEEPVVMIGVVANCEKLNVRSKPNVKSDVVCIITKGTEVEIQEANSSKDFYNVIGDGFNGFCMKKYISVKK